MLCSAQQHKGLSGTFDLILYVNDGHINVYTMNHACHPCCARVCLSGYVVKIYQAQLLCKVAVDESAAAVP